MMRFSPVQRPRGWQTKVFRAGRDWLQQGNNCHEQRPKDLWSPYRDKLARGFHQLCGYTVMWTPNGTVAHFVPWNHVRGTSDARLAYEWSNLRFSVGWFNSSRKLTVVPDPFHINNDWFELLLPSLELVATSAVPPGEQDAVNNALKWLGKDKRIIGQRREYFKQYRAGRATLEGLDAWAPLLSRALRNNTRFLTSSDRARHRNGTLPPWPW